MLRWESVDMEKPWKSGEVPLLLVKLTDQSFLQKSRLKVSVHRSWDTRVRAFELVVVSTVSEARNEQSWARLQESRGKERA